VTAAAMSKEAEASFCFQAGITSAP